jgi:hypothetical protein
MVEQQPSKLNTRVRFPSPAPFFSARSTNQPATAQWKAIRTGFRPTPLLPSMAASYGIAALIQKAFGAAN